MDSMIMIGIGNLLLILIIFTFTLLHLKSIGNRTQLILNGVSHVWGAVMELKMLEGEEE